VTESDINTVDDYIKSFPENIQLILQELREIIKTEAPEALEKISYQMPTFFMNGNLVHFAGYKNHIGFYPAPSGITAFKSELENYKYSKGALQFPLDRPLPAELIRKIVKFRVNENRMKKK
jgi:uncharacterized protein YdhG (YjbR/CyaY superfamily)